MFNNFYGNASYGMQPMVSGMGYRNNQQKFTPPANVLDANQVKELKSAGGGDMDIRVTRQDVEKSWCNHIYQGHSALQTDKDTGISTCTICGAVFDASPVGEEEVEKFANTGTDIVEQIKFYGAYTGTLSVDASKTFSNVGLLIERMPRIYNVIMKKANQMTMNGPAIGYNNPYYSMGMVSPNAMYNALSGNSINQFAMGGMQQPQMMNGMQPMMQQQVPQMGMAQPQMMGAQQPQMMNGMQPMMGSMGQVPMMGGTPNGQMDARADMAMFAAQQNAGLNPMGQMMPPAQDPTLPVGQAAVPGAPAATAAQPKTLGI